MSLCLYSLLKCDSPMGIGECLSLNATFKAVEKAIVVDKEGKHHKIARGGMLNVINEDSQVVAWVSYTYIH